MPDLVARRVGALVIVVSTICVLAVVQIAAAGSERPDICTVKGSPEQRTTDGGRISGATETCFYNYGGSFDRPTDDLFDLLYGNPVATTYFDDVIATKMIKTRVRSVRPAASYGLSPATDQVEVAVYLVADEMPIPERPVGVDHGANLIYPLIQGTPEPPPFDLISYGTAGAVYPVAVDPATRTLPYPAVMKEPASTF